MNFQEIVVQKKKTEIIVVLFGTLITYILFKYNFLLLAKVLFFGFVFLEVTSIFSYVSIPINFITTIIAIIRGEEGLNLKPELISLISMIISLFCLIFLYLTIFT